MYTTHCFKFHDDSFETLHVFWSGSEDLHVAWIVFSDYFCDIFTS